MRRFYAISLMAVLTLVGALYAENTPEDAYVRSYQLIKQAESQVLVQPLTALESYLKAEQILARLKESHPRWNSEAVADQLKYAQDRIGPLTRQFGIPQPKKEAMMPVSPAIQTIDLNRQIDNLRAEKSRQAAEHARQVTEYEKRETRMQEKLKEALAARPRELNPGELSKVEGQNRELRGELVYLKSAFEQGRNTLLGLRGTLSAVEKVNETLRNQLSENIKDSAEKKLRNENTQLRQRIIELNRTTAPVAELTALREQLLLLQERLDEMQARINHLDAEKKKLEKLLAEAP